jgi:hypothetical protein
LAQLERHELGHVELRTQDNSVRAERTTGAAYMVGYPSHYGAELVGKLRATETRVDAKPNRSAVKRAPVMPRFRVVRVRGGWRTG